MARRSRNLIRIGLPVTLASLMQTLVGSLDRLIVAAVLGVEALGQYAFAVSVASIGAAAGLVVRTAVFPDVFHAARHGAPSAWVKDLERLLLALAWMPVAGAARARPWPSRPWSPALLPDYAAAIGPARIFIFSGVANGLMMVAMLGNVAADRQRQVPLLTAAGVGGQACSWPGRCCGSAWASRGWRPPPWRPASPTRWPWSRSGGRGRPGAASSRLAAGLALPVPCRVRLRVPASRA